MEWLIMRPDNYNKYVNTQKLLFEKKMHSQERSSIRREAINCRGKKFKVLLKKPIDLSGLKRDAVRRAPVYFIYIFFL